MDGIELHDLHQGNFRNFSRTASFLSLSDQLTNLRGLIQELKIPYEWIRTGADAGRIPCLRIGRKRFFKLLQVPFKAENEKVRQT